MTEKSITYHFSGNFEPSVGESTWSPLYPIVLTDVLVKIDEIADVDAVIGIYIDDKTDPIVKTTLPANQLLAETNKLNIPILPDQRIRIDILDGKGRDLSVTLVYKF